MRATRTLLLTLCSLAGLLAGCESNPLISGKTTVLVPIAGGQMAKMTFGSKGPILEENADFKITGLPTLAPDKAKGYVDYEFGLEMKSDAIPRSITVDDFSEDPILVLVQDKAPHLTKRVWRGSVLKMDGKDKRLGWLTSLDDSVRVMRFTVVLADGSVSTVNQAVSYPAYYKEIIRKSLGLGY